MSEWKKVRLDTIGKIVTGKTPKTSQKENFGDDILFLTPSDDMCSKYCYSTKRMLSTQGGSEVKNCILPINSICVSCIGSDLGKVIKTTKTTVTNQQINSIIVNDDFDNDFIYYALIILGQELKFISKTSTAVPIVNKSTFSNYEIYLPDNKIDQTRIAKILSSLDDKIELNNRINKNLEEQAQALFKQWFVDFEFPYTDGKPYRSSSGEMIESELGIIPKGWKVGKLGEYCRVKSGFAFKSSWWLDKGIQVVKIKNIESDNRLNLSDCSFVSIDKIDIAKDFLVQEGDLLIAMTGATIGKFSVVPKTNKPLLVNQRVGKFFLGNSPIEKLPFLYCLLKEENIISEIINRGQGSAQPNISPSDIETIEIAYPTNNIINSFNEKMYAIFNLIIDNNYQNQNLAQLRDALLPRLMNGDAGI